MPITAFLEDLLKAPAIHLPLGQSSDNAHLPNERIRYLNLTNGKAIIQYILQQVGARAAAASATAAAASAAGSSKTHAADHHSRSSINGTRNGPRLRLSLGCCLSILHPLPFRYRLTLLSTVGPSLSPHPTSTHIHTALAALSPPPAPSSNTTSTTETTLPATLQTMHMPTVVRRASSVPAGLSIILPPPPHPTTTEPAIHRPTTARSPSPGPLQRSLSPTSMLFTSGGNGGRAGFGAGNGDAAKPQQK